MLNRIWKLTFLTISVLITITGCSGGNMTEEVQNINTIKDLSKSDWDRIGKMKIYFGHHSVGYDLLGGLSDLMKENRDIRINIQETEELSSFEEGVFAHSGVGENFYPESKIRGFENVMNEKIQNGADVAFFKFCFVDLNTKTDLDKLFNNYESSLNKLKESYPDTSFIHVTVPLTSNPSGIKGLLKKAKDIVKTIIGKGNMFDNKVKYRFNEKLRELYEGKEPFFDLAKAESTYSDGKRVLYNNGDDAYYELLPEYTYDGGHLNKEGRTRAAEELLLVLSSIN